MKIKRLEINGFKSFADKVVLDFQQNVTGVVGPNGCGKSNIVDAIRWCMGEQSAKNLRGKAMEDVIFAGSDNRKQLGVAEVSLIFSTEDGRAPAKYLDYSEIQLTRRLYRDGDSDYLINKTPCRLMDITELFMDTGVGTRAYSIIEQGKIGMILHSRPEERRFLIEEAAGVTKFKSRKNLALKKIESTRQNLSRLADVLGEIKRQLSTLQRQAKKAENFREFRNELREIELLFVAREYGNIQNQRAEAERELLLLNEWTREVFASASVGEAHVETARIRQLELEKELSTAQEELFRVKSDFAAAENGLGFYRKEQAALEVRLKRLAAESGDIENRLAESAERRSLTELRRDTTLLDSASMQEELDKGEQELAGQRQLEEELERKQDAGRKELFTTLSEVSKFKFRLESAQKRLPELAERLGRHGREGVQLNERLELTTQKSKAVDEEITSVEQNRQSLQELLTTLRRCETELKERQPELDKLWQKERDALGRASSRLHSLQELEAQFAGYRQGVRSLMKEPAVRSRFAGVIADAVDTPPELEAAVEALLGDRLQSVLCNSRDDALFALDFLKKSSGGRADMAIPLELPSTAITAIVGCKPLLPLIKINGAFQQLISGMLAPAMLVDSIEQALELSALHPALVFVTADGDMATFGGVVTGGSTEQVEKGIIHKKREIKMLEEQLVTLEANLETLAKERETVHGELLELSEELRVVNNQFHQSELKLTTLTKDRQQVREEVGRIEERLCLMDTEFETLEEERQTVENELLSSETGLKEATLKAQALEQETSSLKENLAVQRLQMSSTRERVTAIRVQTATLKEQHEAALRDVLNLEQQVAELLKRMAADKSELESGALEQEKLKLAISQETERLETLLRDQSLAVAKLDSSRQAAEVAAVSLAEAEAAAKKVREDSDAVRQSQADLTLKFSTLNMQAEHLERSVQENSRISMSDAMELLSKSDFDEILCKTRQKELQKLLDEMGEVNLLAIEECAGMEERFNFLSTQKSDLEDSLSGLQQAIQRINRTTRQRFLETYNLVNAKFQEVFPRLFCGGHAELRLTNEDDLLETGIDIIVQPPGKKLQNVTLLSGGEKALTAVALIFSIFLIKPTPFCLLDEVDAPLDDANIGRFNEMVREMSAVSQFIIITHNKATMQVADTLYGITMEEPGASKMVSVRLN